jgi:3-hydroxyisobutyrate dehydrogenase-like beta-hydroxyacid dehydrogenase
MGQRMAHRLLDAGYALTVWNRSEGPAEALAARGATMAATPADAVRSAALVLSMLTDDDASAAVWLDGANAAMPGIGAGTVLVEAGTVTPGWIARLDAAANARGARLLDAPVAGSRPQAEAGALVFFVGGNAEALEAARPVLSAMGQRIEALGGSGRGAETKLLVNGLFAAQLAAMAEALAIAESLGVAPSALSELLATLPTTSPGLANAARLMAANDTRPMFTIDLVAKDLGYLEALAAARGIAMPALGAAAQRFRAASAQGDGARNVTALFTPRQ